jgi:hypothetical protein
MAEYCTDCARKIFGLPSDFKGLCEKGGTDYAEVLCEGCGGIILVDHEGTRVRGYILSTGNDGIERVERDDELKLFESDTAARAQFLDDLEHGVCYAEDLANRLLGNDMPMWAVVFHHRHGHSVFFTRSPEEPDAVAVIEAHGEEYEQEVGDYYDVYKVE